jgi:hypothetical protein
MQNINKLLALLLFAVAQPANPSPLSVLLVHDQGLVESSLMSAGFGEATHRFCADDGSLYSNGGFTLINNCLASTATLTNLLAYDPIDTTVLIPVSNFAATIATLNAINGRTIMALSQWVSDANLGMTNGFSRSAETYPLSGVPYVIVSIGGSGGVAAAPLFTGRPTVTLTAVGPAASESGPTFGQFMIALNAPNATNTTVYYNILGTAKNGKDYRHIAKKALIPAGNVSFLIEVEPINDNEAKPHDKEETKTVILQLVNKPNYIRGPGIRAKVIIDR